MPTPHLRLAEPLDDWEVLWMSFERELRADTNITSARTPENYREGGRQFREFLLHQGRAVNPAGLTKADVENFMIHLREDRLARPATLRARFSALRRFFNWCELEGEIVRSPMWRMRAPRVDEPAPAVLTDDEARRLLRACEGRHNGDAPWVARFQDRRDVAIIRLMLDTGMRRFEVAAMKLDPQILSTQAIEVVGKGQRREMVFFGVKVARDIDRYLRLRPQHPKANLAAFWLSAKGGMSGDRIHEMVVRRAKLAAIERAVWPHLLRHTWAHTMKAEGASDEDVMTLGRWRDRKVMARYARSTAVARAAKTARRLSPGDRL